MCEEYKYSIQFQYLKNGESRPEDLIQDDDLYFNENEYPFIPNVGDSVCYQIQGKTECRKVLSKHFTYWPNEKQSISVNIVVTDIDTDDMAKRLKE